MGMSHPVTSVALNRRTNEHFSVGAASLQGYREDMEDYHTIALSLSPSEQKDVASGNSSHLSSFFGVYDGHGGTTTAQQCSRLLYDHVLRDLSTDQAIARQCLAVDAAIRDARLQNKRNSATEREKAATREGEAGEGQKDSPVSGQEERDDSGSTAIFCAVSLLPEADAAGQDEETAVEAQIQKLKESFFVSLEAKARKLAKTESSGTLGSALESEGEDGAGVGGLGKAGGTAVPLSSLFSPPSGDNDDNAITDDEDDDAAPGPPPAEDQEAAAPPPPEDDAPPPPPAPADDESAPPPPPPDGEAAQSKKKQHKQKNVYIFKTKDTPYQGTRRRIVVGNIGDSRCVLGHWGNFTTIPLSADHKPSQQREKARIVKAGGRVTKPAHGGSGPARVDDVLAVCRAFGDFAFKDNPLLPQDEQKVIAVPDFNVVESNDLRHFLFLGCDGVFDVMSNEEVVEFISQKIRQQLGLPEEVDSEGDPPALDGSQLDPALIVKELALHCVEKQSKDNVTAMLVLFTQGGKEAASDDFAPGELPPGVDEQQDEPFFSAYRSFARRYGWTLEECRNFLATGDRDQAPEEEAPTEPDDDMILAGGFKNPLLG